MNKIYALIILVLVHFGDISAQCCINPNLVIKDESTQSLRFKVTGAVNNDLSKPGQGVCKVSLRFRHDYIGDLNVTLVSPSGQSVQLIGPSCPTTTTQNTVFDVMFVKCTSPAGPDPGLNARWSNCQKWGILGNKTGTYWPASGCLENFNTGTVNGTWTLIVSDVEYFYEGIVERFCLEFCDKTGMSCNQCDVNAGAFDKNFLTYKFCKGNPNLNIRQKPIITGTVPNTFLYGYKYYIAESDTIVDFTTNLDMTNRPPGVYTICGVSYLLNDEVLLPKKGLNLSFKKIIDDLSFGKLGSCTEITSNCLNVTIYDIPKPTNLDIKICSKDTFKIGGKPFNLPGNYTEVLKNENGCDSVVNLKLSITPLIVNIAPVKDLDCNNSNVTIDARGSSVPSNSIIKWLTFDGNIVDQTDSLNITVNKQGRYKLIISNNNCSDSMDVDIINTTNVPELSIIRDTITCLKPTVTIRANTNKGSVSWQWKDDSGNSISTNNNASINKAGKYTVVVTDATGCTNIVAFRVPENKILPKFALSSTPITCRIDTSELKVFAASSIASYDWVRKGVSISNDSVVIVKDTGLYTLTAIGINGCQLTKNVEVPSLIRKPDFRASIKEITCKDSVVRIRPVINSPLKLLEYYRNLPDTFYAKVFDPQVRKPGQYKVRVVDTADCVLDTFVEVFENVERPNIKIVSKNLACGEDSVKMELQHLSSTTQIYEYRWTGPPGYNYVIQNPWAKERGVYKVVVTLPNGCETIDSVRIEEDTTRPRIELKADSINCIRRIAKITTDVKNAIKYEWEGPNGFKSDSANLNVTDFGFYVVTVTASNNCTSERTIEIVNDTLPPFSSFKSDTINCAKPRILLSPKYHVPIDSTYWSLNGLFYSNDTTPVTSTPGLYKLFSKGKNGCVNSDSILIGIDTVKTPMTVIADTITCLKKSAAISPDPIISGTKYRWATPWLDTLNTATLNVENGGTYYLHVVEKNGCITDLKGEIVALTNPPDVIFKADTITCRNPTAKIISISNEKNLNFYWFKADSTDTDSTNLFTQLPGKYSVTVTNEQGCVLEKVIDIPSRIKDLKFSFTDTLFNCINKNQNFIDYSTNDVLANFWWINTGINDTVRSKRVDNVMNGEYQFYAIDPNGCEFRKRITIVYDTMPPVFTSFKIDTINCINKIMGTNIKIVDTTATISWKNGANTGTFNSTQLNPSFPTPGQYILSLQNKNFCTKDTTINIIVDTAQPQVTIMADSINCKSSRSTAFVDSPDKSLSIVWVNQRTNDSIFTNPLKAITADKYIVIISNPRNKCEIKRNHEVIDYKIPPTIQVNDLTLRCAEDSIQVAATTDCSDGIYYWELPRNSGVVDSISSPFMRDTGEYKLTLVCESTGCVSRDTFIIFRKDVPPSVSYSTDQLSCKKDSIYITLTTSPIDTIFEWKFPDQTISTDKRPVITQAGQYSIKVSNSFGCSKDTIITIGIDSVAPNFSLLQMDTLRCDSNIVRLRAIDNLPGNLKTYTWSTTDGKIINTLSDRIIVNQGGTYTLMVRDSVNGCTSIQNIKLAETADPINSSIIDAEGIKCFGNTDGRISILNVIGGSAIYQYSLNNGPFSSNSEFKDLAPDIYNIRIKDKWGCSFDTTILVADKAPLELDILRDTLIVAGETVQLEIKTNVRDILSAKWSPSSDLSCDDCIDPIASPIVTKTYELILIDSNGCEVRDIVTIEILTDFEIYVPTVFSPNGDGINDILDVVAQRGVVLIESYRVFDRWGALVFENLNFDPTIQNHGWKGLFKGQDLNPGVYVYEVVGRSKAGDKVHKFGDVTLLR